MPFRQENRHTTLAVLALALGIMVIGAGIQLGLSEREDDRRQAAIASREVADRAYADCLTDFAADLVETIEARTDAASVLEEARARKDQALDTLLSIVARAQAYDADDRSDLPPGLLDRYEAALLERVDAQRDYDRVAGKLERTREQNPYVSPKVVCER